MSRQTPLNVTQGLVGALILASGGAKLAGGMRSEFERFGYPPWFRIVAGAVEVTAATGLLAGLRDPRFSVSGGLLACGTMAGALWTHLVRAGDPPLRAAPAGVLLGLAGWITAKRSTELRRKREQRAPHRLGRAQTAAAVSG